MNLTDTHLQQVATIKYTRYTLLSPLSILELSLVYHCSTIKSVCSHIMYTAKTQVYIDATYMLR